MVYVYYYYSGADCRGCRWFEVNNDRAQELRRYEIDRRRWSVQEFHVIIVLLKDRDGVKRVS
jgi:hypothetical protein